MELTTEPTFISSAFTYPFGVDIKVDPTKHPPPPEGGGGGGYEMIIDGGGGYEMMIDGGGGYEIMIEGGGG